MTDILFPEDQPYSNCCACVVYPSDTLGRGGLQAQLRLTVLYKTVVVVHRVAPVLLHHPRSHSVDRPQFLAPLSSERV